MSALSKKQCFERTVALLKAKGHFLQALSAQAVQQINSVTSVYSCGDSHCCCLLSWCFLFIFKQVRQVIVPISVIPAEDSGC